MDARDLKAEAPESGSSSVQDEQSASQSSSAAKKSLVKKRTKTGCLTCRRRRIKCDEGKPRCSNCIKSKRQCDGYSQRVIFKDPMSTFQANHMGSLMYQNAMLSEMGAGRHSAQGALPFIAPRPPMLSELPPGASHLPQPAQQQQLPLHAHSIPHAGQMLQQGQPAHPDAMAFLGQNLPNTALSQPSFAPTWQTQLSQSTALHSFNQMDLPPIPPSLGMAASILPTSAVPPVNHAPWAADAPLSNDGTIPSTQQFAPRNSNEGNDAEAPARYNLFSEEDAYWYSDDDASMVESEDEDEPEDEARHLESNDLGVIVARRLPNRHVDIFGTRMRTFSNFADANVLSTYIPSSLNSPLTDAQTAAVFWYFVNVTGPSMSLFERRPVDPTPIFQGQPVPRSRQHIWTYIFPTIALNHPALLQAMLALGSLQMAKLQGQPHTASMKHYHLSLRRIARNYQSASRRVQPATLAATMLLGFYEVWNSDHDKWCKHMWGGRAILKEIPIRDMTAKILALKRQERRHMQESNRDSGESQFANTILAECDIDQVDSSLVARLSGQRVAYEETSSSASMFPSGPVPTWSTPDHYTEKDIETYELIADLFWWYCKMDVYQSILGGTPVLMEYGYWTQCAPRAPIGKIDAIYGTYDHLILLLGRLCNFSAKDMARKRRAKKPEGPSGSQGQSPPGFAGMMPSTGHITIPKGFSPPREVSPQSDSHEEVDFETSTAAALREWEAIRRTFEVFRSQLGPDFEPLGPEYEPPVNSPFGMTLKYRTYSIAGIWLNYFMGLIVLNRCHPSMPPVAMAAAGLSARQTAPYANDIGRIVAGLTVEDLSQLSNVSTLLGGISIESSFPLFVAAVQFQDTAQRHWTVKRLHSVARLTGWQSALQIASGCETGWVKAAAMRRGPPYEPPPDLEDLPQALWSRPRRIIDRIRELEDDDERLVLTSSERPHYAFGLLSMEADLERLELTDA